MADAEQILLQVLNTIVQEQNYRDVKLKAITSGGANYTSSLFLATVTAPTKEDVELFAKVAIVGEKMRLIMDATRMFTTEIFVYTDLAKTYDGFQEKFSIPVEERFLFPKFFGCNPKEYEETVVLENLVARGFKTYNRFKSIDWDHASGAVKKLAKFHGLSFAYEKEKPEEFKRVIEQLKFQRPPPSESLIEVWKQMMARAVGVCKEDFRENLLKYFEDHQGSDLFRKYNEPMGRPVLIHGDYRPSNLLFKKEGDKVHAIPVDYQTVHSGSPVNDLVYFVFMGSDAKFRSEHYQRLIELYYDELGLALKRLGLDIVDVYPREEFDGELKAMLPYAVLLSVSVLPIVTVEAENAPKVDGAADFNDFVVAPNELYAERFCGIIEDCVRWGVI